MSRQLPPFAWLQAFEATARHLSFTRAAIELNITQTAVSHRIRNLERLLGIELFIRDGNTVRLTDVAHDFLTFDADRNRRNPAGERPRDQS